MATTDLRTLDRTVTHTFIKPVKRIHEGQDVSTFLVSIAYQDVTTFLTQLNHAMFPRKDEMKQSSDLPGSPTIVKLQALLTSIDSIVDEVPLDPGSHRFGNTAFRKWFQLLEEQSLRLLESCLPGPVLKYPHSNDTTAIDELQAYLLGSFGSAQRLDYGTGHELSFLAFLAGIWKTGGFQDSTTSSIERGIVLGVIVPYLALIRKLILKYSLEPAGSHGVWGLDDHSFLPYIFGSAQYGPEIAESDASPVEGSSSTAPDSGDVVKANVVERERMTNLYFGAIGFIYDVKKGPFWEHSPTLFDISGVRAGWAKINKGMLKMYNAEVLSKFPVVQHFPFGSLFSFERDPEAKAPNVSVHTASQPTKAMDSTAAPWAKSGSSHGAVLNTAAPWARSDGSAPAIQRQPRGPVAERNTDVIGTKAPWAK